MLARPPVRLQKLQVNVQLTTIGALQFTPEIANPYPCVHVDYRYAGLNPTLYMET